MNKLLFFSLSLLMNVSTFSMEKEFDLKALDITEKDIKATDLNDLKNVMVMLPEIKKMLGNINASFDKAKEEISPKEILTKFNEQAETTANCMKICKEKINLLNNYKQMDIQAQKKYFNDECAKFEQESNTLYTSFLIPQTKTCNVCVNSPKFHKLLAITRSISSDMEKVEKSNLICEQIDDFSSNIEGLLASLNHVKAEVEKK